MEHKRKCNVCGKIYCFTDEDLKNNAKNAGISALEALGGLASTLGGGTIFHTQYLQGQSDRYADKVVDYDQCPYCHSRDISVYIGDVESPAPPLPEPAVAKRIDSGASTEALLKRAYIFLEDEDWESADAYCEACLDRDPELARAYLGKLLAELELTGVDMLRTCAEPFDESKNYKKALRYADATLRNTLTDALNQINTRKENARLNGVYKDAKDSMAIADTEEDYTEAARLFECISEYRDSAELARTCREKAEIARKDAILAEAGYEMASGAYESAIRLFASIPGWKDADQRIDDCNVKLENRKAKEEAERLEKERQAKRTKRIVMIAAPIVCVIIAFVIVLNVVIIPNSNYKNALALMNAGQYEEAIAAFEALDGYKDSKSQMDICHSAILDKQYNAVVALMDAGKYEQAIAAFEVLCGYEDDSDTAKYAKANLLLISGKSMDLTRTVFLEEAGISPDEWAEEVIEVTPDYVNMLEELQSRETSGEKISKEYANLFAVAGELSFNISQAEFDLFYEMYANDIEPLPQVKLELSEDLLLSKCCLYGAKALFEELGNYRDSESLAESIPDAWQALLESRYQIGEELLNSGDYDSAQETFQSVGNYRDSADKALLARNYAAYTTAQQKQAQGNYTQALQIYRLLGDFEAAAEQIPVVHEELLQSADVGDCVYFGSYEQDNDTSNGTEDIEWLVLDKQDNRILVISKYALDCQKYNARAGWSFPDATWSTCSLRSWLNSDFLNAAFSADEQKSIPFVTVSADRNTDYSTSPGSATKDQIFVLSLTEANKYFENENVRKCTATDYAIANGASVAESNDYNCWWWLRTPGYRQTYAVSVKSDGRINRAGDFIYDITHSVRPAMWIDLGA